MPAAPKLCYANSIRMTKTLLQSPVVVYFTPCFSVCSLAPAAAHAPQPSATGKHPRGVLAGLAAPGGRWWRFQHGACAPSRGAAAAPQDRPAAAPSSPKHNAQTRIKPLQPERKAIKTAKNIRRERFLVYQDPSFCL